MSFGVIYNNNVIVVGAVRVYRPMLRQLNTEALRYLSPLSGAIVTTTASGGAVSAIFIAAQIFAPEDIPQNNPSFFPSHRAISNACSSSTVIISSTTSRSRLGVQTRLLCLVCHEGLELCRIAQHFWLARHL